MVRREILAVSEGKQKGAITLIPEKPRTPKLVSMHFTSIFTCRNFFNQFYFLTPWTIVHGPKGNFGRFWRQAKRSHNSDTGEATPTKIGFHAFHVNLYLHKFFEPILFFDPLDYSPWSEGKFCQFLKTKRSHNSDTREATPTKIGFHAFHLNLYLHKFFEPTLFFDPRWTVVHDASYIACVSVLILDKVMLRWIFSTAIESELSSNNVHVAAHLNYTNDDVMCHRSFSFILVIVILNVWFAELT